MQGPPWPSPPGLHQHRVIFRLHRVRDAEQGNMFGCLLHAARQRLFPWLLHSCRSSDCVTNIRRPWDDQDLQLSP